MRTGKKIGLSGSAAGFAVAIYFTASPVGSSLASGQSVSVLSVGALLGVSLCAVGALFGMFYSRKGSRNA